MIMDEALDIYPLYMLPALLASLLGILALLFSIWMIVDCIRSDNHPVWILIILLTTGVGAVIYFAVHKMPEYEFGRRWHSYFAGRRRINELKVRIRDMDRPHHWAELGDEYRAARRWEEAADAYQAALERDPAAEDARYGLGLVMLALGRRQEALEQLRPLAQANPRHDYGGAATATARALRGLDRRDEALAAYESVLAHYDYSEVRYEYADLLYAAGRRAEARAMMERIVQDAAAARGFHRSRERKWGRRANIFLWTHPE